MKKVRYASYVEGMLVESINQLVSRGYFSDEEYAVAYIYDLTVFFQLNLPNMIANPAPSYFSRYGRNLQYVSYRKNSHTTWYAFFEETDTDYHILYLGNNHTIGQYMEF